MKKRLMICIFLLILVFITFVILKETAKTYNLNQKIKYEIKYN